MTQESPALGKIPAITLGFWIIKIFATTLGETAGDTVSMSMDLGYLFSTVLFAGLLSVLVITQTLAKRFHPFLYWATIIASTTAGTTLADFADRSLGVGYPGGTLILSSCVLASLAIWYRVEGTVSTENINTPRAELLYWITITFSQTLGTALGDWVADAGAGYDGGALIFGALLAIVAAVYFWTAMSHVLLFWTAFILTRPLGATIGDYFDKPLDAGGLNISRPLASAILAAAILICILIFPQRAGEHPKTT